jgi:hypothetical protein
MSISEGANMPENETPTSHVNSRENDPPGFVFDHVGKLQYLSDKVKQHDTELINNKTTMVDMIKSLAAINANISAVKWAVIGCAVMLVVNQFGFISTIKMWLLR